MYIKLYLTRQEKTQLDVLAKQKQMSVSKLCHDRVFPLQDLEGVDLPQIKESIQPELSSEAVRESFLDELIQVMLYQEISRRRCRRHRCRRYF